MELADCLLLLLVIFDHFFVGEDLEGDVIEFNCSVIYPLLISQIENLVLWSVDSWVCICVWLFCSRAAGVANQED